MVEIGSRSCCSHPQALVVIAAIPLCQAEALQSVLEDECLEDCSDGGLGNMLCNEDVFSANQWYNQEFLDFLPLRCACVMDCQDAIGLMQEVGHVVL